MAADVPEPSRRPGLTPYGPRPNVDRVNVAAGLDEARAVGYDSPENLMVVEYALMRHWRGEEHGAEQTALHGGIDLTSWRRILARAITEPPAEVSPRADSRPRRLLLLDRSDPDHPVWLCAWVTAAAQCPAELDPDSGVVTADSFAVGGRLMEAQFGPAVPGLNLSVYPIRPPLGAWEVIAR